MKIMKPVMVFDVESIGLHGEGFAVGYVVIEPSMGVEVEAECFACDPDEADGSPEDRAWVRKNIPAIKINCANVGSVEEKFWAVWLRWSMSMEGVLMAADCGWPVESRFLMKCVDTMPEARKFSGPYPLVEILSVLMSAGFDPMTKWKRLKSEMPEHDPVADARQSARLLIQCWNGTLKPEPEKRGLNGGGECFTKSMDRSHRRNWLGSSGA